MLGNLAVSFMEEEEEGEGKPIDSQQNSQATAYISVTDRSSTPSDAPSSPKMYTRIQDVIYCIRYLYPWRPAPRSSHKATHEAAGWRKIGWLWVLLFVVTIIATEVAASQVGDIIGGFYLAISKQDATLFESVLTHAMWIIAVVALCKVSLHSI